MTGVFVKPIWFPGDAVYQMPVNVRNITLNSKSIEIFIQANSTKVKFRAQVFIKILINRVFFWFEGKFCKFLSHSKDIANGLIEVL